ncbi:FAD-binding oxidoreductase [Liquorilactobacillus vini]|uniref:FAD FMN-containing dehydrogenase n=2 Tax=Liquorilactobacillus vini TaxID=238015 RepID=A0A0R2C0E9_9LACO|nr:FAD-linked oxidase C-terminal domain-containing protein [Liquorilactobacillus vini]KRM84957.1 FAD FMN-containing dehydrogenase [Liquorilactobacillus vini DSM 20605]
MTTDLTELTLPNGELIMNADRLKEYGINKFTQELNNGNQPLAAVKAQSVADVQAVMKFANSHQLPVTARAAATSIVNSSAGLDGGLVLDLSAMNRILKISIPDQIAIVEPGVMNGDLDQAVRKSGYFFAPDPGSKPISSIGGNIATNAGGMSSLKYGTTKQSVYGLKVVLADGTLVKLGGPTFKNNTGYDLTDLFVGSEGTLGIIVEATVRLMPLPFGNPVTGLATFENMKQLSIGVQKLSGSGLYPSMMEALNDTSIEALDRLEGTNLAGDGASALLIFQLDSAAAGSVSASKKLLQAAGALQISVTDDADYAQKIIKIRQDYYQAEAAYGRLVVEDVAVPLSKLPDLAAFVEKLKFTTKVKAFLGGHAGDGNFHPNIAIPKDSQGLPTDVQAAIDQIFEYVISLGGTISSEHGIGQLKNKWVVPQLGEATAELQKKIKAALDPNNILNPGRKL